ncbi:MAG TPA: HdeD family acid-resistance protein [Myxococcaceae bacterium]|nr:HdeD family acid-resistance protein [Myxococcaceae bacterium]
MTAEVQVRVDTPDSYVAEVRRRSGWSIFMGVVLAALGLLMIVHPYITGTSFTVVLGWVLVVAGLAELVLAFQSQTPGGFFLRLLVGALYLVMGIVLLVYPFSGLESLTLFVGVMFIARGLVAGIAAYEVRGAQGWQYLAADAVISLVVGILTVAKWPSSSEYTVGILAGAALFATGLTRIIVAAKIHSGAGGVQRALGHT